mmetsp:Transcript_248/g.467  ORF Transcript_248/g.467 Transcript_248/m.467 type:complete len:217 (-) Transcript_248:276-926(-)
MAPNVEGRLQQLSVIRSDVDADGKAPLGVEASARCEHGKLAYADSHSMNTQVAKTQNSLPVRDHHEVHASFWPVSQNSSDVSLVGKGDPDPLLQASKHDAVLLARHSDSRHVNDRSELVYVIHQNPVEKSLIALLQRRQVSVPLEVALHASDIYHAPLDLQFLREDSRRKQALQVQPLPLLLREGQTLVVPRVSDQLVPCHNAPYPRHLVYHLHVV